MHTDTSEILISLFHLALVTTGLLACAAVCVGALVVGTRLLRKRRYLTAITGMIAMIASTLTGLLAIPAFLVVWTIHKNWALTKLFDALIDDAIYFAEAFVMTMAFGLLTAFPMLLSLSAAERRWPAP